MLTKEILCYGKKLTIGCDGKCNKAWGIGDRPSIQLSDDEDDIVYLSDGELGDAPINPNTFEGGYGKPINDEDKLNKWCYRRCERCIVCSEGNVKDFKLNSFSKRVYNKR